MTPLGPLREKLMRNIAKIPAKSPKLRITI